MTQNLLNATGASAQRQRAGVAIRAARGRQQQTNEPRRDAPWRTTVADGRTDGLWATNGRLRTN
eukprot:9185627-Lingulodinium_polyedra.AAC.1